MLLSVGVVKIIPCENSRTFVNGKLVTESTVLRSGECWNEEDTLDRVLITSCQKGRLECKFV